MSSDATVLQAELESLVSLIDLNTDAFDCKSPALSQLTKYIRRHLDEVNKSVEGDDAKANQNLKRCFLMKLDNPWLTGQDVEVIHERHGSIRKRFVSSSRIKGSDTFL
jgi:hypothetical protein